MSLSLLLPFPCLAQSAETTPQGIPVHLVLVKINSYTEFKEIRDEILKIPGVDSVTSKSEARELITLGVNYSDSPENLIGALRTLFDGRYSITPKKLTSGIMEINLSPLG